MFRGGLLRFTRKALPQKNGKGSTVVRTIQLYWLTTYPNSGFHASFMYAESKFVSAHKFVPALP